MCNEYVGEKLDTVTHSHTHTHTHTHTHAHAHAHTHTIGLLISESFITLESDITN